MVEFAVALIVIIMLLAGLVQIGRLANTHTQTMIDARATAAESAMATGYSRAADAAYIYSWLPGSDGKPYTQDDLPMPATNAVDAAGEIVALARPDELADLVPDNDLSTLGLSEDNADEFFLVGGEASGSCPTLPALRHLALIEAAGSGTDDDGSPLPTRYHAYDPGPTISLKSKAWLVWTEGLYLPAP